MCAVVDVTQRVANGAVAVEVPALQLPFNARVPLVETGESVGTGWLPPVPDMRDYTADSEALVPHAEALKVAKVTDLLGALPAAVDLRQWCSPIENQLSLGSCTANAAVGMVEYFERRAFNRFVDGSRLFVYKTTRDLLGLVGDTGAFLRSTMAALAMFGVPPEKFWPYTDVSQPGPGGARTFDQEPGAFIYELAEHFDALTYFSYDPLGQNVPTQTVLANLKAYLAAGVPAMFGFYGFPSFGKTTVKGGIPYPCPGERAQWGHAIVAVGYDDTKAIDNTACQKSTTGALLIRNSWGTAWGDAGYGWLPYQYVLDRLASDFWSMTSMHWIETGQFGI